MPTVIDWNTTVDPSDIVRRACEILASGAAVVFPRRLWLSGALAP